MKTISPCGLTPVCQSWPWPANGWAWKYLLYRSSKCCGNLFFGDFSLHVDDSSLSSRDFACKWRPWIITGHSPTSSLALIGYGCAYGSPNIQNLVKMVLFSQPAQHLAHTVPDLIQIGSLLVELLPNAWRPFCPVEYFQYRLFERRIIQELIRRWDSERELLTTISHTYFKYCALG